MGLLRDVKPRSVIGRAVRRLVAALARDCGAEVAKIHAFALFGVNDFLRARRKSLTPNTLVRGPK